MRRLGALLLLAAALLVPARAAQADPIASCTTTRGAIVAVDFGHWGGPVVRGCAVSPKNGFALLTSGGFTVTQVARQPGFVCRLGNGAFAGGAQRPTSAEDSCANTPPANAYWGYFVAPAGQAAWTYSSNGAADDHPGPGEVEAWVFGAGTPPTFTPDSVRAHNAGAPSSTAPTRASAAPTRAAPTAAGAAPTTARGVTTTSGSPPKTGSASSSAAAPTSSSTAASSSGGPSTSTSAPTVVDAAPTASTPRRSGSAVPLVVTVVVVAALAAAGGATAWRRRRA